MRILSNTHNEEKPEIRIYNKQLEKMDQVGKTEKIR